MSRPPSYSIALACSALLIVALAACSGSSDAAPEVVITVERGPVQAVDTATPTPEPQPTDTPTPPSPTPAPTLPPAPTLAVTGSIQFRPSPMVQGGTAIVYLN